MAVQGMNRGMAQRRRLASMSCIEKTGDKGEVVLFGERVNKDFRIFGCICGLQIWVSGSVLGFGIHIGLRVV